MPRSQGTKPARRTKRLPIASVKVAKPRAFAQAPSRFRAAASSSDSACRLTPPLAVPPAGPCPYVAATDGLHARQWSCPSFLLNWPRILDNGERLDDTFLKNN